VCGVGSASNAMAARMRNIQAGGGAAAGAQAVAIVAAGGVSRRVGVNLGAAR